ncbi:MAG: MFS transporter, partial [Actinocatenispora sp.]
MLTAHGSRLRPFPLLWAASTVSALGDGVRWIALPLLAASASGDPRTISLVTVAEQLPWLLFALVAGALADRFDRRRTLWAVDAVRAVLMTGFAVLVATGTAPLPVVLAVAFALSAAGTLHDSAAGAYVPALVEPARRSAANSRMQAGVLVADTLVGSPLGATLFAVAAALPFGLDAVSFVVAAALVWLIPARAAPVPTAVSLVGSVPAGPVATTRTPAGPLPVAPVPVRAPDASPVPGPGGGAGPVGVPAVSGAAGDPVRGPTPQRPGTLRADVLEGVRFLLGHRLLRRLCWLGATVNLTTTAAVAILVLYATRVLHLDKLGYGLLVASFAVGGVGGALVVGRLARAVGERVT